MFDSLYYGSGENFEINNKVSIKQLKIEDVKYYGENAYSSFITAFCAKPFDLIDSLYLMGIRYEDITDYELFSLLFYSWYVKDDSNIKFKSLIHDIFSVEFLKPIDNELNEIIYIDEEKNVIIDKNNYEKISDFIKNISGYENAKVEKFENEPTREAYIENIIDNRDDEKEASKKKVSMFSMVGAIVLETSYTYESVWQLYMYQFHMCASAILKRQEYKNIMLGVYTGNIDTSKMDLKKYNWLIS